MIASVLLTEMFDMFNETREFDEEKYKKALEELV